MKLKNLCLAALAAYTLGGTNAAYGSSERFKKAAWHATATAAHWIADYDTQAALVTTSIAASILIYDFFKQKTHPFYAPFLSPDKETYGPLFCTEYMQRLMGKNKDTKFTPHELRGRYFGAAAEGQGAAVEKMIDNVITFTKEEYKKNHIVLYSGQSDVADFYEKIFKALTIIQSNTPFPENFVPVRFKKTSVLHDTEVKRLREYGIKPLSEETPKILFTNMHLLDYNPYENAIGWTFRNGRNGYDELSAKILLEMFTAFNFTYEQAVSLFEPLQKAYTFYKAEVIARGNSGRLIAFSIPPHIAQEIVYPAETFGILKHVVIDNTPTTNVVEIARRYGQTDDQTVFCLILSDLITNPEKAANAGIVMRKFTSQPTEESKKCAGKSDAAFAEVMNHIAQMHKEYVTKGDQG